MDQKPLPIGIDNFEKLITRGYYFVDKTLLIKDLLDNKAAVNLFTRPRRFGKTLNMSMLEHFFSIEGEENLFEGLEIAKDTKLCEAYRGKYPVIFLSLKGINAGSYDTAFRLTMETVKGAAKKAKFLEMSEKLDNHEKEDYRALLDKEMDEATLFLSLKTLSELLEKHYGEKSDRFDR